jgi:hypothetical protein
MSQASALCMGMGLGAGLMYLFDPQRGRSRRAWIRDKGMKAARQATEAAGDFGRDLRNRAQGMMHEARSWMGGDSDGSSRRESDRRRGFFRGQWSSTARLLLGAGGLGLTLWGLTKQAPTACIVGSVGLGLLAAGVTGCPAAGCLTNLAGSAQEGSEQQGSQQEEREPRRQEPRPDVPTFQTQRQWTM